MNKKTGVIGCALVPHAPQMLSLPKTEDAEQVARVRAAMLRIGDEFRKLEPDVVIVICHDHGDNFLYSVPPFMIHCGNEAEGKDEHSGLWNLRGDIAFKLYDALLQEPFDPAYTLNFPLDTPFTIPLDFMGYPRDVAFLPVFVNSYAPPQPHPERCFEFGKALDRSLQRLGLSAVIIGSGGMSHYPGTAIYSDPGPDHTADEEIYQKLVEGNFRFMLSFDQRALDKTGNIEIRPLLIAVGAYGKQAEPDIAHYETNWHHNYAVVGWTKPPVEGSDDPIWYQRTQPERVQISQACHELRIDPAARQAYIADPAQFADRFRLEADEREALFRLDQAELRDKFGVHAVLAMLAPVRVKKERDRLAAQG